MMEPRPEVTRTPAPVHGGPSPGEPFRGDRLDFSSNVNPWGPWPGAEAAARAARPDVYPDPAAWAPRRALARAWDEPAEAIRFAPGAAELIHRIARTFLRPGDRVLLAEPTFGEYRRAAVLAGAEVEGVRGEAPDFALPLEAVARACRDRPPRLVHLCAPNSPTGEDPPLDAVREVARSLPDDAALILDGSFRSFAAGGVMGPELPAEAHDGRVLHVRSLTKDLAVPGLRAGAVHGAPALLEALDRAEVPWSAPAPAQAAVAAALEPEGLRHVRISADRVMAERARLTRALRERGWAPLGSQANYLLCRVGSDGAGTRSVVRGLAQRGVRVRDCASFGLPDHVRVAVRRPSENARLLEAIRQVSPQGAP